MAEDEPRQADLLGRLLARENHTFQLVDDGRKALDEIRGRRPDLLVLDLMLPVVDGWACSIVATAWRSVQSTTQTSQAEKGRKQSELGRGARRWFACVPACRERS